MAFTKNKILWWIGIELLILIVFAIGVVVRVADDNQSDLDIIVTFTVLGCCLLLLVVTVAIYLRSYGDETTEEQKGFVNILDQRKLAMKLKPIHKNFASDCAICLLPKDSASHTIVQITCNHDYHEKCIKDCFQKMDNTQCPECRQHARDYPATVTVPTGRNQKHGSTVCDQKVGTTTVATGCEQKLRETTTKVATGCEQKLRETTTTVATGCEQKLGPATISTVFEQKQV